MTDNLRGILAILVSSAGFVLNDATVKLIAADLPAGQTLFLRGVLATTLLFVVMHMMRQARPHRLLLQRTVMMRSITGAASGLFIALALQQLPLASVNAVIQLTPLCVMAGAGLFFGERIGIARWVAALVGFGGVALVLQPWGGTSGATPAAIALALIALTFTFSRDLFTRGISAGTPPLFIAYGTSLTMMALSLALGTMETWIMPSPKQAAQLALSSVLITIAYTFGIISMRTGELSVVAPFRYVQVPLAVLLSWVIWNHRLDMTGLVGIGLVLAAGLFVVTRERATFTSPATRQT